ncbi:MAG: glycosyltransferase [Flavobacteriales bacterium]|nr:glycosyltransferase [Flavobacteriales bacterium]
MAANIGAFTRIAYLWCMPQQPRILVAPLDWGLGHATRCIPVVHALLDGGAEVILGGSEPGLSILKEVYPQLASVDVPGYNVRYARRAPMALSMAFQMPRVMRTVREENKWLDAQTDPLALDAVVSDNRYGLWSDRIPCVFMSHQIHIQAPALKHSLYRWQVRMIRHFREIWVPDDPGLNNLSGDLSHGQPLPANLRYVGPLSRFNAPETKPPRKGGGLVLLSGPEPQRTILEHVLARWLKDQPSPYMVVRGWAKSPPPDVGVHVKWMDHLPPDALQKALLEADHIICRSGYSTLMDLDRLGRTAIVIPTPGQTEQEYLAERWMTLGRGVACSQHSLQLDAALASLKQLPDANFKREDLLTPVVKGFVDSLKSC